MPQRDPKAFGECSDIFKHGKTQRPPANATTSTAVTNTFRNPSGSRRPHDNCINWSYRNRGNVARSHTNRKANTATFISSHHGPFSKLNGPVQPPKNRVAAMADTVS